MKTFDTKAALAASKISGGQFVRTYGSSVKGDSSPSLYYVVPASEGYVALTDDVTLTNGLVAKFLQKLSHLDLDQRIISVIEAANLNLAGILSITSQLKTNAISLNGASELTLPPLAALPPYSHDFHIKTSTPTLKLSEDNGIGITSEYTALVDNNNYSVRHKLGTNAPLTPNVAPYAIHYKGDSVTSGPGKRLYTEGERVLTEPDIPMFYVPAGVMLPFGGTVAPTGYLLCDGTAVSRTTYANLFAVIGTSFGSGDGSTTFHLPKSQGQTLRFVDHGAGVDPDAGTRAAMSTGGNTGDAVGSVQLDDVNTSILSTNGGIGFKIALGEWVPGTGLIKGDPLVISSSRGGSETRSKNFYANLIIKY